MSVANVTSTPQGHVIWSPQGKPVSAHLSRQALGRLQQMQLREPVVSAGRATEIGGLLVGFARQSEEVLHVAVEEIVPLRIEHVRGASFTLGVRDRRIVRSALKKFRAEQVVGWFRTHTRPGLFLDEHDFKLYQEFFGAPLQIALLVKPGDSEEESVGGVFFWEEGDVRRSSPYQTFPIGSLETKTAESQKSEPQKIGFIPPEPPRTPAAAVARAGQASRSQSYPKIFVFLAIAGAGLALGLYWNPRPLKRSESPQRRERLAAARAAAKEVAKEPRAVFTPPSLPESAPEPEPRVTTPYIPPPEPVEVFRARSVPAPRKKAPRTLAPPPARRPAVSEPVLENTAPSIIASVRDLPTLPFQRQDAIVETTVETVRPSALRRVVGSIPGFGFLKRRKPAPDVENYTPAKARKQVRPKSPQALAAAVPVRLRLSLSSHGEVERTELLTRKVEPLVAQLAMDAVQKWQFEPARLDDKPVASEVVVQFRFPAVAAGGGG
ncbi:MAG: energy transducer TonB [Bryobacteraceae bacterium]|nr:energy transducer TonB [Bryobacteraceae bacterium]